MVDTHRIVAIDHDAMTVTVEAGICYGEPGTALHEAGLALANLLSLPHITVGGAIATGMHGSGVGNPCLSAAVRAIEYVRPSGELVTTAVTRWGSMEMLPTLEAALADLDPRPHWGKLTAMSTDAIRSRADPLRWSSRHRRRRSP